MIARTLDPPDAPSRASRSRTLLAATGALGPACFITGWTVAGTLTPGYSFTRDAISQLARIGAPHRVLMTAAFVGFGVSMTLFAKALSDELGGRPWLRGSVMLAGVATLAVAAVPLSRAGGTDEDVRHAICATVGYVGTALSPILGGVALRAEGRKAASLASFGVGALSAAALSATPFVSHVGLFQRLGLSVVDVWFAAVAIAVLRHRLVPEAATA